MKRKLLFAIAALLCTVGTWAGTDVTASYIGDVTWIVNGGGHNCGNNHKESNGIGWWNSQTLAANGWHAFVAPNATGGVGESWTPGFGSAGVMMGRTMVLPEGNYTLSFAAFACNATNSSDPSTLPSAGDAVAFLTGQANVDITNTAAAGDATFHNVSFTFDVTTANTAYEFGIKKLTDESKVDWCQIKNVTLTLNSTDRFPVPNDDISTFTYSGNQTWHTNTWSTEGQRDGSRFQVPFHELWVASGGKLEDATITGTHTPTETGVYKVCAWVRATNESGGAVSGVKIFVGDAESDACTGSSVMGGNGRLGTYTAMADGVAGTPFSYGFKIQDATVNWLSFKNVTITYLGELPAAEVSSLIAEAEALEAQEMDASVKSALTSAKTALASVGSVANYNALVSAISDAQASADNYAVFAIERDKALALGMDAEAVATFAPNVQDLMVAEYNHVSTTYSYGVSLGAWTTDNATDRDGQHWDGTTGSGASKYSEQLNGWGADSWSCSYSQNITLPAGNYVFKVAGRKSSGSALLTLSVTNGGTELGTVNDFPNGDTGKGIDTSGATNFGDGTFANDGTGRGWQWRYVKFTLADPATVTVSVNGSATAKYQWVGFCNPTVQTDDADNVALMEALVALNDAKTAANLVQRTNVGTAVFQYIQATDETLWSEYSTAKSNADAFTLSASSEVDDIIDLKSALTTATTNYSNNTAINQPEASKRYNVAIVEDGKAWNGNAITFIEGGRTDMGGYGIRYLAPANANLNQALKFTAVEGEVNTYKVSAINVADGKERYITTGTTYTEVEGNNNSQIRTTDDAEKASWVKVRALGTDNQFQLLNVSDGNKVIANNGNNDMYTAGSASFTIAEATQASVDVNIAAGKYATRIFPFTPSLPSEIKAYSCAEVSGSELTLVEVPSPVANTPYILYSESGYTGDALTGWGTATANSYGKGLLTGVYTTTEVPADSYVLQTLNEKQAFYQVDSSNPVSAPAYRAYLTVSDSPVKAFFFNSDDADAIQAVEAEQTKTAIFNLAGQRINKLLKGVNIINGKKVILK